MINLVLYHMYEKSDFYVFELKNKNLEDKTITLDFGEHMIVSSFKFFINSSKEELII